MPLTYKDAGVDIDKGDRFVERIRSAVEATHRPEVLGGLGGFGAPFALDPGKYQEPILISGTDGVGTKLMIAFLADRHDTVGIDLVAMSVNDVLTTGAEPLFFLDYVATGGLEEGKMAAVVQGIAAGCRDAGCALIGGETAEMPGFYRPGEYDLAGFCVGVVDKAKMLGPGRCAAGDTVIGLPSSGLHSNGYSLARKVLLEVCGYSVDQQLQELGRSVADELLEPTRIYVRSVLGVLAAVDVHALAHITGGGLPGNLNRVLGPELDARLERKAWQPQAIFHLLAREGDVEPAEMFRAFNMGIGFCLVVAAADADRAMDLLRQGGESPLILGEVVAGSGQVVLD